MAAAAAEKIRPLRRVEYDKLVALGVFEGERIELIDGVLLQMSPIGPDPRGRVSRCRDERRRFRARSACGDVTGYGQM